jgi:NitT/TauT family transport system substrate-binding protein
MRMHHPRPFSRRRFLRGMMLAGTAGLLGLHVRRAAAEPLPETTRLRIADTARGICTAPQYVAEELLRGEGFTDLQYLRKTTFEECLRAMATGEAEMLITFVSPLLKRVDAGDPIVMVAGSHVGCFELFGTDRVRTIRDLKGKTVAVPELGSSPDYLFLSVILLQVGLDPSRDVQWVEHPAAEAIRLLVEGKVDAFLGFPPSPQELRAQKIGHVLLNSTTDRPWSQYFCCMVAANRDFVHQHPVATKRAVRAFLKSADLCALEPEQTARLLVDKGYAARYDYALQALRDLPYAGWHEYSAEDTVRFYALRLHEAGLVKSSPQKLIAQGTDWRFLNKLEQELKG